MTFRKIHPIKPWVGVSLLGMLFSVQAIEPIHAKPVKKIIAQPCCRDEKQAPRYAGDCGPNPPPGYREDLKILVTGFSRDFSCYVMDEY